MLDVISNSPFFASKCKAIGKENPVVNQKSLRAFDAWAQVLQQKTLMKGLSAKYDCFYSAFSTPRCI